MKQSNQVLLWQADTVLFKSTVLPVSGGPGVEDVLFGREQRQAVGIKVDRLHTHDGKGFQATPAASFLFGPHGFRGRTICWKQPQRNYEGRSRPRKQQ